MDRTEKYETSPEAPHNRLVEGSNPAGPIIPSETKRTKSIHTALLFLGLAFLVYLVWKVGGPHVLWQQLTSLGWGIVPLILSEGLANLAHTAGWRNCLSGPHRPPKLFTLFRMAMAGFAINYLTPTASLGGEVTKAALLASKGYGPEAVSSVLVDKLCLAVAHLVLVLAGSSMLFFRADLPLTLRVTILLSTLVLAGGIVGFLLLQKHGRIGALIRWTAARGLGGRLLERAAHQISAVDERLKAFYRESQGRALRSVGWHLLGHSMGIAQTWLFFHACKQPLPLSGVINASVLCLWFDLVTFAVPLNLGTLEGGRILALKAIGSSALHGMTYGVIVRTAQTFWVAFGLASYGWSIRQGDARMPISSKARPPYSRQEWPDRRELDRPLD
jgi:uncharacterized membrane protein YbhN (UPF0104 family)